MWFKNAIAYRFTRNVELKANELEAQLEEFKFQPCGTTKIKSFGWTQPLGEHGEMFSHFANGAILLAAKDEQKLLPTATIKKETNIAVLAEEALTGFPVKKTQKDSIRDAVIARLIPQAFTKEKTTKLLIIPSKQLIIVDASSFKAAEDALALLRKTIGSLPVVPLCSSNAISLVMTNWLKGSLSVPTGFKVGDAVELLAIDEAASRAKLSNESLIGNFEVESHIEANKQVVKLALDWQDRISFKFAPDYSVKGIKFSDELKDQNEDIDREDVAQRLDADFCLMVGELTAFYDDLAKTFPIEKEQN
ncbi:recombination-associated protein RdgC [Photobacterium leiognathi]|uniref:recombination-associated protein RdgC n=1 Tax=Photobacterium leiognathi TaxID=553611 RepID=UPI001EE08815|nr:recombination-associated protein RdgC [Photobacterium leiognathi]MCG3884154.1 recombination-associated protein RdgC [Photobacterium leiognathi]